MTFFTGMATADKPDVQKQITNLYVRLQEVERRLLDLEDEADYETRTESRLHRAWMYLVRRFEEQ